MWTHDHWKSPKRKQYWLSIVWSTSYVKLSHMFTGFSPKVWIWDRGTWSPNFFEMEDKKICPPPFCDSKLKIKVTKKQHGRCLPLQLSTGWRNSTPKEWNSHNSTMTTETLDTILRLEPVICDSSTGQRFQARCPPRNFQTKIDLQIDLNASWMWKVSLCQ